MGKAVAASYIVAIRTLVLRLIASELKLLTDHFILLPRMKNDKAAKIDLPWITGWFRESAAGVGQVVLIRIRGRTTIVKLRTYEPLHKSFRFFPLREMSAEDALNLRK